MTLSIAAAFSRKQKVRFRYWNEYSTEKMRVYFAKISVCLFKGEGSKIRGTPSSTDQ